MTPPEQEPFGDLPPIFRRIMETVAATRRGEVAGVDLRFGQGGPIVTPPAVALAGLLNTLGLGFEGLGNVGKGFTGAHLAAIGAANRRAPLTKLVTPGRIEQMGQAALDRYLATDSFSGLSRGLEANEAAARGNEVITGLVNELYNPANIADVARGGQLLAQKVPAGGRALGRLARDLLDLGPAQGPKVLPGGRRVTDIDELLDPLLGPDLPPVNGPDLPPELGPEFPSRRGNVDSRDLIPGIGRNGGRGIGPALAPEQGPMLPALVDRPQLVEALSGNVPTDQLRRGIGARVGGKNPQRLGLGPTIDELEYPTVDDLLFGPRDPGPAAGPEIPAGMQRDLGLGTPAPAKVTDLLEPTGAQAPARSVDTRTMDDLLAAEGIGDWANLDSDSLALLVRYAYRDQPNAISNAWAKYQTAEDVAARAWERITADNEIRSRFMRDQPELARKLARLPGLGEVRNARLADEALLGDDAAKQAIEESPYFAVFSHFDRQGNFRRNPVSGKRYHRPKDLESILNSTDLDTIAAEALAPFGGYNPRWSETVDDFWHTAREKFLEYQRLTGREAVDELGYTADGRYLGVPGATTRRVKSGGDQGGDLAAGLGISGGMAQNLGTFAQTGIGSLFGTATGDLVGGFLPADSEEARDENRRKAAIVGGVLGGGLGYKAARRFGNPPGMEAAQVVGREGVAPSPPSRRNLTLQTAGLGGIGGYAAGQDDDPDDERNAALFGAVMGGVLGGAAGSRAGQAMIRLTPALWREGVRAQREAWQGGRAASLSDIGRVWKTQTTSTIRNLLQDEVISRIWLARAGVRQEVMNENWYSLVDLYRQGRSSPYEAMPERSRQMLDRIGKGPMVGPSRSGRGLLAETDGGYVPKLGASLSEENDKLVKALHPLTTAGIEAGLSLVTPLASVPVAGVALGAIKGLARPAWTEIFQAVNRFTHAAARHAVWQESMVDDLAQAGQAFIARDPALARLSADGLFSADEVLNLTGDQALADEWGRVIETAITRGEQRAKDVFGDFSNERWWETLLGRVVPFASWALRAYPRTIAMLAEHPGVTLALLATIERDSERAKEEGRPGYQVGTTKLGADTPVIGKLLGGLTAGAQGDLRVNFLSALTPFSGELFAGDDTGGEELTPYQKVKEGVQKTGFSFNPFIVGLAYALDWDYIRPGALSRTSGIEQAQAGPEIPSFAQGPLDFVRERMGGNVSQTTPAERRLAQNVYDETGYALSSPHNQAIAAASVLEGDPRMAEAERQTGQGGLVRNLASLVLPATVSAETDTAAYARRSADYARANPAPQVDPGLMMALRQQNPLLAIMLGDQQRSMVGEGALINRGADRESRAYAALDAWEEAHAVERYFMPQYYFAQRSQLREMLGLPREQ